MLILLHLVETKANCITNYCTRCMVVCAPICHLNDVHRKLYWIELLWIAVKWIEQTTMSTHLHDDTANKECVIGVEIWTRFRWKRLLLLRWLLIVAFQFSCRRRCRFYICVWIKVFFSLFLQIKYSLKIKELSSDSSYSFDWTFFSSVSKREIFFRLDFFYNFSILSRRKFSLWY